MIGMNKFRCKSCLYIHEGLDAPDRCIKCGAPKDQFERIPDNFASLIDRSHNTNNLLIQAIDRLNSLSELSEKGIQDNLDPACLYLFQHIKDIAAVTKRMALAEIQTHSQKNKWG